MSEQLLRDVALSYRLPEVPATRHVENPQHGYALLTNFSEQGQTIVVQPYDNNVVTIINTVIDCYQIETGMLTGININFP